MSSKISSFKSLPLFLITALQVGLLGLIWFGAQFLVVRFHLPLPANVLGMFILFFLIFSGMVKKEWFMHGARWLLAEMLLFFIPAVLSVINYEGLVKSDGLKIFAVLFLSTCLVLGVTAWVVDKVYHFELKLAIKKESNKCMN